MARFSLWNTKNFNRDSTNKQNKYTPHREKYNFSVSDMPFFRRTPTILPAPPFLWENSEPHAPFLGNFENSTSLYKGEGF